MATTPRDRRRLETIESIAESMIDSSGERLSAMESTVGDLQEVAKTQTKQIATKESYQVLAGSFWWVWCWQDVLLVRDISPTVS